jgi:hypothetical protein
MGVLFLCSEGDVPGSGAINTRKLPVKAKTALFSKRRLEVVNLIQIR